MKKYLLIFSFFFLPTANCILPTAAPCFSQTNLVPNPSFEDTIECPYATGETHLCKQWIINVNSADYFHSCNGNPLQVSVPQNAWGYQFPANGNAYFGLYPFIRSFLNGTDVREFFGCKLITPFIAGQKYYASFKASLSGMSCAHNNIGILFTNIFYGGDTLFYNNDTLYNVNLITPPSPLIRNYAHINAAQKITDTMNWVNISGSFIADSNYTYMLIGNFFDYSLTDTIVYSGNQCGSYYYIDDVCVSSDSLSCDLSSSVTEISNGSFATVHFAENLIKVEIHQQIISTKTTEMKIFDLLGREVFREKFSGRNFTVNIQTLSKGMYVICLQNMNRIYTHKIIK